MDEIRLPELPEMVVEGIVAVSSSDLKVIVDAHNALSRTVVAQQKLISNLADGIKSCREDITKIAKILEALYEP